MNHMKKKTFGRNNVPVWTNMHMKSIMMTKIGMEYRNQVKWDLEFSIEFYFGANLEPFVNFLVGVV